MSHLLEALNSDEANLKDYNLFITILGYNDLELDKCFFKIHYKHVLVPFNMWKKFTFHGIIQPKIHQKEQDDRGSSTHTIPQAQDCW